MDGLVGEGEGFRVVGEGFRWVRALEWVGG